MGTVQIPCVMFVGKSDLECKIRKGYVKKSFLATLLWKVVQQNEDENHHPFKQVA